ncbi:MAG: sulfur carrier protein ThiS [Verrucomicrobiota bacterium]|nr:sulfur carrier protein ThiS [Verrucomicrobiota bacterium]
MTVTLNGKFFEVDAPTEGVTISDFVSRLEIGKAPVLVELNGEAVLVREFESRQITDGDTVEVIRMVAGG